MQPIHIDKNGDVVDSTTGNVVGKRDPNGSIRFTNNVAESHLESNENKPAQNDVTPKAKISYTKYDVRPDSEFTIRFCLGERDGRIVVFEDREHLQNPALEQHWVTFRMWTFKEQLEWKEKCTSLDVKTRMFVTNPEKYNEMKLVNLMKSWSFQEIDDKYKLTHTRGYLTDESIEVIEALYPSIVNSIIFLMNQVLEGNM